MPINNGLGEKAEYMHKNRVLFNLKKRRNFVFIMPLWVILENINYKILINYNTFYYHFVIYAVIYYASLIKAEN